MKLSFTLIFSILCFELGAQPGYAISDVTGDFRINKILNYTTSSAPFSQFKNKLLVIDFFGTWCLPCVKALPHLTSLQEKYKDEINIVLVSEESQEKLESFIKKRNSFIFPLVVDEEKKFVSFFKPPSYPYTVIVGKNNKILAFPTAEELSDDKITQWLKDQEMNKPVANLNQPGSDPVISTEVSNSDNPLQSKNMVVQLSQEFMYAAKTGDKTSHFVDQFEKFKMDELNTALRSDDEKKAFWINLYNAYTQVALMKDSGLYKSRRSFFGSKKIEIAGEKFSLDDIEHGILRRSKIKWSLGYLNKIFPGKIEKLLRVNKLDYRLHFALNCGAKSCPPIAFYNSENINEQLDLATNAYLKSEAEYDAESNIVGLPAIMNWFRRDFGGKKQMIALLHQLSLIPKNRNPKIKFKTYDWTLYLQNYKS